MDSGAKAAALSNEQNRSCSRPMMMMQAAAQGQKTGVDLFGSAIETPSDLLAMRQILCVQCSFYQKV